MSMPNKSVIVSSWPLPLPPHPCCGTSHPHPASRTHRDLWVSAGAISLPVSWDWKQMAGSSSTGAHRSSKEPAPNGCNREDQPPNPITHLRRPSATPVCRPRAVLLGRECGCRKVFEGDGDDDCVGVRRHLRSPGAGCTRCTLAHNTLHVNPMHPVHPCC